MTISHAVRADLGKLARNARESPTLESLTREHASLIHRPPDFNGAERKRAAMSVRGLRHTLDANSLLITIEA